MIPPITIIAALNGPSLRARWGWLRFIFRKNQFQDHLKVGKGLAPAVLKQSCGGKPLPYLEVFFMLNSSFHDEVTCAFKNSFNSLSVGSFARAPRPRHFRAATAFAIFRLVSTSSSRSTP